MTRSATRKPIWGWYFFDWASQPYSTLLLTFIFSPYFAEVARNHYISQGFTHSQAAAQAQSYWGWGLAAVSLAVALLAPYVNSYRRYVPDFAAPINLDWGRDNRTTGLRIPISTPAARRVENRLPGMDCNPYLGIAASLACGYLGLLEKTDPRAECVGNAYTSSEDLPYNLGDALDVLAQDKALCDVLGQVFCGIYTSVKRNEYKEFLQVISPWEREHLLLNV